ncbi:hypothetical protein U0070_003945, partial [Myodes glareolus]
AESDQGLSSLPEKTNPMVPASGESQYASTQSMSLAEYGSRRNRLLTGLPLTIWSLSSGSPAGSVAVCTAFDRHSSPISWSPHSPEMPSACSVMVLHRVVGVLSGRSLDVQSSLFFDGIAQHGFDSQFLYQLVKSSSEAVLVGNEEDVQEPVRHAATGCHQDCG